MTFLLITSSHLYAQRGKIIIPGPEPFSLDAGSAVYCIDLLKNTRFIELKSSTGESELLVIRSVWSLFLGVNEDYPEGHRLRYDIIVNGSPLNWDNSFIEYGGEMLNLRLLFFYRNQHPPQGLKYRSR